jgi:hypothetical protein
MFSFANVMHFFPDEFSGLRRGRLAFPRIFFRPFNGFAFRHGLPPEYRLSIKASISPCNPPITVGQGRNRGTANNVPNPPTFLWTRDKQLRKVAEDLSIGARLAK